ncbi:UNVERIFIED_CONTAM: hypothetical protein Slati_0115400 [Sesamum latifolium]|uniref:Uncharacterized protein n=1 Tax=Sesamum latifolium TaxID=2727402 RepID=A0AAW2Y956_9LAMI
MSISLMWSWPRYPASWKPKKPREYCRYCCRKSCATVVARIGGSYIEQLSTIRSQVISIDAWSMMGTDAQFHALDQGRETVDGRTVPIRTRSVNVHATNSPSLYIPWTIARRPPMVTGSPDQGLIKSY